MVSLLAILLFLSPSAHASHLKVRAHGKSVVVEDNKGSLLERKTLSGEITALARSGRMVAVAVLGEGIFLLALESNGHLSFSHSVSFSDYVHRLYFDKAYLFVATRRLRARTYSFSKGRLKELKGRTSVKRIVVDSRFSFRGKVTAIRRGVALVPLGPKGEGIRPGDHLEIVSMQMVTRYDPIKDARLRRRSRRSVAVLKVVAIKNGVALLDLGLGDNVQVGDFAYFTKKKLNTSKNPNRRWGGLRRLQVELYPGLIVGDLSMVGTLRGHYHGESAWHMGLGLTSWGFSGLWALQFEAKGGFETSSFEAGILLGSLFSGFDRQIDSTPMGEATAAVGYLGMYVRLGSLDGLSWELGIRSVPNGDGGFNGLYTHLQLGLTTHAISLTFDLSTFELAPYDDLNGNRSLSRLNLMRMTLRDRIRIWGNGGPGSLYLPLFIGLTGCGGSTHERFSFVVGGGFEYRW